MVALTLPTLITSNQDDIMHFVLFMLSVVLMAISANGFRRRPNSRYFFLMLAFIFFFPDQAVTFYQEIYLNGLLISVPLLSLHLVHLLELLVSVSFLTALLRPFSLGRREPESGF
jgi:hypothetical protein